MLTATDLSPNALQGVVGPYTIESLTGEAAFQAESLADSSDEDNPETSAMGEGLPETIARVLTT